MKSTYFEAPEAMKKLPASRAAYSDRTAWMMAEMSALAYLPFEGEKKSLNSEVRMITGTIKTLFWAKKTDIVDEIAGLEQRLKEYIDSRLASDDEQSNSGKDDLESSLQSAGFDLVQTFNRGDTQAFLAKRDEDSVAVLAFRGTEVNSWQDIKSDLNARFYKGEGGAKVHSGFSGAFQHVKDQIRKTLQSMESYSLYITGHSLGGALAIIASKEFERDNLAACYTFGSPRVGSEEFGEQIKAPVYRIVNSADGVPHMPPSWIVDVIRWFISLVNGKLADSIRDRFSGYRHCGDMRYLTACDYDIQKLRLLPNLGMVFRTVRLGRRVSARGFSIMAKDHSIDKYRDKLKYYAQKRNEPVS